MCKSIITPVNFVVELTNVQFRITPNAWLQFQFVSLTMNTDDCQSRFLHTQCFTAVRLWNGGIKRWQVRWTALMQSSTQKRQRDRESYPSARHSGFRWAVINQNSVTLRANGDGLDGALNPHAQIKKEWVSDNTSTRWLNGPRSRSETEFGKRRYRH